MSDAPAQTPLRIEDYALIGDCRSAALVGNNGSIDWLCWPHFDSDACFAALLGSPDNGRWLIAPKAAQPKVTRRYAGDTLILETLFETEAGAVALIDFMPVNPHAHTIVRRVEGRRGRVQMAMHLTLRFEYGAVTPWVTALEGGGIEAVAGANRVVLSAEVPVRGQDCASVADFEIAEGEVRNFCLSWSPSHLDTPRACEAEAARRETERFWTDWSGRCGYHGSFRPVVLRSLLTLKALTFAPTGATVAAPTTSLPEKIGGPRNWDYRYCWLRDATLTLIAMMAADYVEEASAWRNWLHRAVAGDPADMQIMYGLSGQRRLAEWEVDWLPGYAGSKPVRIGNAASGQLQLDTFGELMGALRVARRHGLSDEGPAWPLQLSFMEHLEAIWEEPDEGIWEVRGGRRQFTYSKIMVWFAFDSSIHDAETYGLEAPLERWRALRDRVHATICEKGYDAKRNTFVQSFGDTALDASLLLMPQIGFLPHHDPRMLGTVKAIEEELLEDGFVLRYRTEAGSDGLPPGEGVFLPCSLWLAAVYHVQGREADAKALFDRVLALANDVGLLSEEYDPKARRLVGNFPQAYSHLAVVGAALTLDGLSMVRARQGG